MFKVLFSGKGEEKSFKNIQYQQSKHDLKPDQINHNVQYNNGKDKPVIKKMLSECIVMCNHVLQQ